jgi:hypothetical protein
MTTLQVEETQEHLADGWEPESPHTDSLCRTFVHHWAEERTAFAAAVGGAVVRTERFAVADHRYAAGYMNAVVVLAPPRDWDALLEEVEPLLSAGTGEIFLWSLWPTPDLRRHGWSLAGHPPLLLRPPADVVPVPAPVPAPQVVRTADEIAVWEDVAIRAYPLHPPGPGRALLGPDLLDDERFTFRISHDDTGAPVSVSAHGAALGLGGLAFGATLPSARGRGHWKRHAAARLRARPDLWHAGFFSDLSRPLAEAIGFVPILRFALWYRPRSDREHP